MVSLSSAGFLQGPVVPWEGVITLWIPSPHPSPKRQAFGGRAQGLVIWNKL